MRGFQRFNRLYLRKHFHTIVVNRESLSSIDLQATDSLVLYANHASWWDPLAALYMADRLFPNYSMYAPIDAEAFEKYRVFGRMGFFPVEQGSLKGAKDFLRIGRRILSEHASSLWITPEGRFADVRDDAAELTPGLAHLAWQIASQGLGQSGDSDHQIWFLPAAVEYTFWEERLPELLIWLGNPILATAPQSEAGNPLDHDKGQWQRELTVALRDAQRKLAENSIARNSQAFEVLLRSKSGTFFVYDWWRSLKSRALGRDFDSDHSQLLKD